MADLLKPDLCIIGAGALGLDLAVRARQAGLSVALVDTGVPVPGDAPQAAMQRAALMASANRAHAIRTAGAFGMANGEPKPNYRTIGERAAALAAGMQPEMAPERLDALGIERLAGATAFTGRRALKVGDTPVAAGHFVLATGAQPLLPDLPGLDAVAYFTPQSILDNMRKLSHLLVLGGTPVAVELAQAYVRLGAEVTLVPQGPLLPGFDSDLVAMLLRSLADEGLRILPETSVTAIQPRSQGTGISLLHGDGSAGSLDISHLLLAMGDMPALDADMLAQARLRPDRAQPGRIQLGPEGQTSNPHIWAVGGAAGISDPAQAQLQVERLLQRLLGHPLPPTPAHLGPRLIRTDPPLAQTGLVLSTEALRSGQSVLRANLAESIAARAGGAPLGNTSLIVNAAGSILGGAMLGQGADSVVAALALGMARGLSVADLASLAVPPESAGSLLAQIGRQYSASHPPGRLARLRARLSQIRR